ncbi:hypothetical protein Vi05172_g8008 [Venturia inaequalis]|nr:hypothetical protein Vi05172_g8008 [Venturia inaequalis]
MTTLVGTVGNLGVSSLAGALAATNLESLTLDQNLVGTTQRAIMAQTALGTLIVLMSDGMEEDLLLGRSDVVQDMEVLRSTMTCTLLIFENHGF